MNRILGKTLKVIFVLLLMVSLVPQAIIVQEVKGNGVTFSGGAGTSTNPYQITTTTQLDAVRDNLDKHFILMEDITLSGTWTPIDSFTGVFDGNNKTISGLTVIIDDNSEINAGLFGSVFNASIKNLTTTGASVKGGLKSYSVGILVGYSWNSTIDNVSVSGHLEGVNSVGGIVGNMSFGNSNSGLLKNSESNVTIIHNANSADNGAGGLVGYSEGNLTILSSSAIIEINKNGVGTSKGTIAGLVGQGGSLTIKNSFAQVDLSVASTIQTFQYVGGLVGNGIQKIENSFATGTIKKMGNGENIYIGGLVARGGTGTVQNSYSEVDITVDAVGAGTNYKLFIGGLGGLISEIRQTYYNGEITLKNSTIHSDQVRIGGLFASPASVVAYESFYNDDFYKQNNNDPAITPITNPSPRTLEDLKDFSTYSNWFVSGTSGSNNITLMSQHNGSNPEGDSACTAIWYIDEGIDTPRLWFEGNPGGSCHEAPTVQPTPILPQPFIITYNVNGGKAVAAQQVVSWSELVLPTPLRFGYTFDGWYWDSQFSMRFSETTMPYGDIGVYAKWVLDQQVTYVKETALNIKATNLEEVIAVGSLDGIESLVIELEVNEKTLNTTLKNKVEATLSKSNQELVKVYELGLYRTITPVTGESNRTRISNQEILTKVKILIPVPLGYQANQLVVIFIDEDGNIETFLSKEVVIEGVSYLEFETDHFSSYAIVEADQDFDVEETTPSTSDRSYPMWLLSGLLLIGLSRKRRKQSLLS